MNHEVLSGSSKVFVVPQIYTECPGRALQQYFGIRKMAHYVLSRILQLKHYFLRTQGWWYGNLSIIVPQIHQFDEASHGKIYFIGELNGSDTVFASILLLPHSVRECLACINGSSIKWLSGVNLVWKQVKLWCMIRCTETCRIPAWVELGERIPVIAFLYHLVNDFNICICNCRVWVLDISSTIIILNPS